MTLEEAIALQPAWVGYWLNWLLVGTLLLPLVLMIWRQSRLAAAVTIVATLLGGGGVTVLYNAMGYVKLLGLPHVILWTPVAYFLWRQVSREDIPVWPRRIMWVVLATILVSLAFDYTDVIRYLLGERTPAALPPGA